MDIGSDSKHDLHKSYCAGKMMLQGSVSFNGRELETMLSFRSPTADTENDLFVKPNRDTYDHLSRSYSNLSDINFYSPLPEPRRQRDQAALTLQKVYKSFRTRRQLADCAVLAEQRWWKALDFAELKRSSISFFDIEKPETAVSRWSRARTRAAKVGKGLSKDRKARKLALQHWLEAIDPRHRYGHNLQFYYVKWLHCDSNQPFFYWLDIGEGKEVSPERCPRSKLQQQCIKYLGPEERKAYEVVIENGRLFYKQSGKPVETTSDAKWIFVLSTSKTFYVGQKNKGTFQHSSFLAGGATLSAGRLVVEDGFLKAVWPHSGHYLPTEENFQEFVSFLQENNVDLTDVKKNPDEEEDIDKMSKHLPLRGNSSEAKLQPNVETESSSTLAQELPDLRNEDSDADANSQPPLSRLSRRLGSKIARLEIPKRDSVLDIFGEQVHPPNCPSPDEISESGYETAEESFIDEQDFMVSKSNLFVEDKGEEDENPIPKEKIMKRIDSHKGMKSYQLAYHLSTKWTTGAGPRIGCMRDYPAELQLLILEQQNLSPRTRTAAPSPHIPPLSRFSPHVPFPIPLADSQTLS
ncbi:IQ domain-containing protein IQM6 [Gastrolobium bilobum]|uniref:IQ domain-containing protein IQM6 n=1 Tax=Gastrolobium bilobum TaxID=150636 RepID=UPI002AB2971E|nr:IQ domain-containing protein IQM6 [Gastrolobium bilobum]